MRWLVEGVLAAQGLERLVREDSRSGRKRTSEGSQTEPHRARRAQRQAKRRTSKQELHLLLLSGELRILQQRRHADHACTNYEKEMGSNRRARIGIVQGRSGRKK
jgi:hypothetical protein